MEDPVRGVFKVTSWYDKHPSSSTGGIRITGVLVAPGLPATPAEHRTDWRGNWAGADELPALIDRADPSRFAILWDEYHPESWQDRAGRRAREEADRLNAAAAAGARGVFGDPGRPQPGAPGGGLTPEQAAAMVDAGSGQRGTAVVVAVSDVPVPPGVPGAPPAGVADLTLQVTRADGTAYTARTRLAFSTPERRGRIAVPGAELPVLLDPASPDRIAIDTAALF